MSQRGKRERANATEKPRAGASPSPTKAASGRRLFTAGLLALLAAVVVVAYLPSLDGGMQFDDSRSIEQNPSIKDLGRFARVTFWQGLGHGSRAVAELTFAVDYARGRLEPRPYHVTNMLCHLAALLFLFVLGRTLLARVGWPTPEKPALAAAAIWALHPLNSQAVSYIVQRAEVLASIGYALAVLLVLQAARHGRTPAGIACYIGALVAALLGFESKPITLSLPAAVLAALWVAELPATATGSGRWLARLGLALPFGLAALKYGAGTLTAARGQTHVGFDIPVLQAASYPATQVRVVLAYLRQLAWPDGLSLDHDVRASTSWLEPAVLGSGAVLLALVAGAGYLAWRANRPGADRASALARASRLAAFGLAWWFILLSTTSSVVPLVDLMIDHRPYLASWGVILGVVTLVAAILERWLGPGLRSGRAGLAAAVLLSAILAVALHARNKAWSSPTATWTDVVEKAPGHWRGWQNLGQQAWAEGRHAEALRLLERALGLASTPNEQLDTLRNMGANYIEIGDPHRAIDVLTKGDRLGLEDSALKFNLAMALSLEGRLDEAEVHARRSVELNPQWSYSYYGLGQVLGRRGDHFGALENFQQAVALDPDSMKAWQSLAAAQTNVGRVSQACTTWLRYGQFQAGAELARTERQRLGCDKHEGAAR